jgi:hypothetical protein
MDPRARKAFEVRISTVMLTVGGMRQTPLPKNPLLKRVPGQGISPQSERPTIIDTHASFSFGKVAVRKGVQTPGIRLSQGDEKKLKPRVSRLLSRAEASRRRLREATKRRRKLRDWVSDQQRVVLIGARRFLRCLSGSGFPLRLPLGWD